MLFILLLLGGLAFIGFAAETPPAETRDQIAALRRTIAHHDELYHRQATSEISDADYDQLKQRLVELERIDPAAADAAPPLSPVGDDRSGSFKIHRHRERMLSLDKVYKEAELRAFHVRIARAVAPAELAYVVEPKFDGLAVSLTYEKGRLTRAVTRGNGLEGDDITANVIQIAHLPRELRQGNADPWPEMIELRAEIYVPFAEFERVNTEREKAGEARFANPRNLAAGTIRQLNSKEVARRGLQLVVYGVGGCEPAARLPATQTGTPSFDSRLGFAGHRRKLDRPRTRRTRGRRRGRQAGASWLRVPHRRRGRQG